MDNSIPVKNSSKSNSSIRTCSINIGGLSSRSRMVLDKYINDEGFQLVFLQESGAHDVEKMNLSNMKLIADSNGARNRGALLYVHNSISYINLNDISQKSPEIDSAWAVVIINNKKYIIGSIYVKHHYPNAIKDTISLINYANRKKISLKAKGIILAGDFNARHTAWGDSITTSNGKQLFEQLDH